MKANRTSPGCARVEMLESRRLLSANPAAVHTHPTPPNIVGTYDGTYAATNGQTGSAILTLSSEGTTGKLAGTLDVIGTGSLGIHGSVNVKGKFSIHGSVRHFAITINGSASSDESTLSGHFAVAAKHGSGHGTFSFSKTAI